jgi:tRNA U34 5-methylaminomethyl-2-thiouridine-forming methyltransferase MnmC
LSVFEIVTTSTGAISIRNKVVNEIMHNPVGPWREANDLYVVQSDLKARLQTQLTNSLVLFDVGLGAASNALAAIHLRLDQKSQFHRKLHIVSFENNLELLRFALAHAKVFAHMQGYEEALRSLLHDHQWRSPCGSVTWDLREGDFNALIGEEVLTPEIVFYDPYSPAVNQDMWTLECFQKLHKCCARFDNRFGTVLFTYSVATPVRAAMLLAGFFVGYGIPTGLKEETTQFATHLESLKNPLCKSWYGRWLRSHTQLPYATTEEQSSKFRQLLNEHPQLAPWQKYSEELMRAAFPGERHAVNNPKKIST